jgi:hypothetical protein
MYDFCYISRENLFVKVIITSMYLVGIYEFNITKYISIGLWTDDTNLRTRHVRGNPVFLESNMATLSNQPLH